MDPAVQDNSTLGAILDIVNITGSANATGSSMLDVVSDADWAVVQLKLILTSMALIYFGAYGSLQRPPSAVLPKRGKGTEKDEEEVDDDENKFSQGLEPTDAILFPIMAGIVLVGLYQLIQWLDDPDFISKLMRWYMSAVGLFSLTTLYTHALQLISTTIFPRYWRSRSGALVKASRQAPSPVTEFPAMIPWNDSVSHLLWESRRLLIGRWQVTLKVHGVVNGQVPIRFNDIVAFFLAAATTMAYHITNSVFLSNLLGYGFCYASFMVISPTTFTTGALVLAGLFVYDIVMVFYTPFMITVATKLDVPIKLTFQSASKSSILGLGDIVIPGMVICLALRFDHWLHYHRQIKHEQVALGSFARESAKELESSEVINDLHQPESLPSGHTRQMARKPAYVDVRGAWADWLWTWRAAERPAAALALSFKKTYFVASMGGYGIGMLVTLVNLTIFQHGQPALLYLVPGVLGALFLTGWLRGELIEMWMYTEDGSLDTKDVVVEVDGTGKVVKELTVKDGKVIDKVGEAKESGAASADKKKGNESAALTEKKEDDRTFKRRRHDVFLFAITAPPSYYESGGEHKKAAGQTRETQQSDTSSTED